jgi:hypothetical protein
MLFSFAFFCSAAGKVPLTPSDGSQYQPYGGDYTNAVAGNFTYQVVVQDLNATGAALLYAALRATPFQGVLNQAYTGTPAAADLLPLSLRFWVLWTLHESSAVYFFSPNRLPHGHSSHRVRADEDVHVPCRLRPQPAGDGRGVQPQGQPVADVAAADGWSQRGIVRVLH